MKRQKQAFTKGVSFLLLAAVLCAGSGVLQGVFGVSVETAATGQADGKAASGSALSGQEQENGCQKTAYLTFDDGPSILTTQYLSILEEGGVHATFFLIGQQAEELPSVVKQEIAAGHEIGVHTYCHEAEQIYASGDAYCSDLEQTMQCLSKIAGYEAKLFRFPWGSANAYVKSYKNDVIARMKSAGLEYADWNVSGEDSVGTPSVSSILSNVRKDYKKYDDPVILLHDSATCKATLAALPEIISELKGDGYAFDTLSNRKNPCHFGE